MKKAFRKIRSSWRRISDRFSILVKDVKNKARYGRRAPLYMERIWVNPLELDLMIDREEVKAVTGIHRNKASGIIVNWGQIQNARPVKDDFRMYYCFKHWEEGLGWEELGVFDHMSQSKKYGSLPKEKIISRFHMLDRAFEETRKTRRLKTRKEVDPANFREHDGILVHIGKNGKPYFGGNGFHRLAMAKVLKLEKIPACIGLVDKDSLKYLDEYRNV